MSGDRPFPALRPPGEAARDRVSFRPRFRLNDGRRLRDLFDEAPVGIVALDYAGTVVDLNQAFATAVGAERSDAVGRPLAELFVREDRGDILDQLSKLVMGTATAGRLEGVRVVDRAGRERWLSLFARRIEEHGEGIGLIVHVLDISERRALEGKVAQAEKMQAIGQLAGGIAHDFNNLLTAMLGFCGLLLARHVPGDASHEDILNIRDNALRGASLVRQLLAFSRRQPLKPEVVDVAGALKALLALLGRLLGPRVELRLEAPEDAGRITVDPGQFDQVIVNLAVNARDAMPTGGTVTIRTKPLDVPAASVRGGETVLPGSYVVIEVADTGVGIPKELIGNIFEPFFTTKQQGAGTGLGLATVYGIVRQNNGFIFVDSAQGEGTVFSIYLPATTAAATAPAAVRSQHDRVDAMPAAVTPIATPATVTLLLVEDEAPVRLFAARALRARGYQVIEAETGEQALQHVDGAAGPVDVLISDVVMPGMDGRSLVRLLRQRQSGLKTILMSGYSEDEPGNDAGATLFLQKPFSLADLVNAVETVLGTSDAT